MCVTTETICRPKCFHLSVLEIRNRFCNKRKIIITTDLMPNFEQFDISKEILPGDFQSKTNEQFCV